MVQKILDLHIHSKYSRSCSKDLTLPTIAKTCEIRGIDIVVTGDFTHPAWFSDIETLLEEETVGVYRLKDQSSRTRFILGTEVSCIKKHKEKTRRVHNLVFASSIEVVKKFNQVLVERGCNLKSDGRPILGLTSKELLEIMLEIDSRMVLIPAHAWTPWFAIFGSKSGYDTIEEAFDELAPHIFAIETGLSSDPLMNAYVSALDRMTLVSNSDAHSPQKLGREANVLQFKDDASITYDSIMQILRSGNPKEFLSTIEFFPEEGKYHYDGHAACNVVLHPNETKKHQGLCPACKKPLTIGVMHRVMDVATRTDAEAKAAIQIPYTSMVPLPEILADIFSCGVNTKRVKETYAQLLAQFGNEFHFLLNTPIDAIIAAGFTDVAEALSRVRRGELSITPGYDGVFGTVHVFGSNDHQGGSHQLGFTLEK